MSKDLSMASIETRAETLKASALSLLEIAMGQEVQSRLRLIISDCRSATGAAETSPRLAAVVLNDIERRLNEIDRGIVGKGPISC